jgi:hypothetical protein
MPASFAGLWICDLSVLSIFSEDDTEYASDVTAKIENEEVCLSARYDSA